MENSAAWEVRKEKNWAVVAVAGRLDSFNFNQFCDQLESLIKGGESCLALDLSRTKFLSFLTIKYLTNLAEELEASGGNFALLAASEKLKRQIDIYATLNPMKIVRNVSELHDWDQIGRPANPKASSSKAHAEP